MPFIAAEARLAALVGPTQVTAQPVRIAARLFWRRDERCTSRRWREARRPSPSPRHEHTARRRNPNKERRAPMLVVASNEPVAYTCTYCMWNNVRFPLLGFRVWRFPQGASWPVRVGVPVKEGLGLQRLLVFAGVRRSSCKHPAGRPGAVQEGRNLRLNPLNDPATVRACIMRPADDPPADTFMCTVRRTSTLAHLNRLDRSPASSMTGGGGVRLPESTG